MKHVKVMRGIPGSGKSRYIADHFPGALVVSADHHFIKNGEYVFVQAELKTAHLECWRKFLAALSVNHPLIVVDNTNTSNVDVAPYVQPAEAFGYEVEIITIKVDPAIAAARNVHGVPEDVVIRMNDFLARAIDMMPKTWKNTTVDNN